MSDDVELVVSGRPRSVGNFDVSRVLPHATKRSVGPFVFLDHMGPVALPAGEGMDVRPHPHIGLSTVTYLFEGELVHRDSLGSVQVVRPGAIDWMTAGRGIVHSERSTDAARAAGARLHGLQIWVALPSAHLETEPEFDSYDAARLPELDYGSGVQLRILAGEAYGARAPTKTWSSLFYVDASLPAGSSLALPSGHAERAAYVVSGAVSIGGATHEAGHLVVVTPGGKRSVHAERATRLVLIGGAPLDYVPLLDWNFVGATRERLARARLDWKERRFPSVPTDDVEFIPLPE